MKNIDLYDFKFNYKFKKGDVVRYNTVIFKEDFTNKMQYLNLVVDIHDEFIELNEVKTFFNWWEIVPANGIGRINYWIRFYIWYYMKLKRL